jgi:hypothetical protein
MGACGVGTFSAVEVGIGAGAADDSVAGGDGDGLGGSENAFEHAAGASEWGRSSTRWGRVFDHSGPKGRANGAAPERRDYGSFVSFSDPVGNGWLLQALKKRAPGR